MKKYLLLILVFIVAVSCDKRTYEVPKMEAPVYETDSEIMTIAELKTYALQNPGMNQVSNSRNYEYGYLQDPSGVKDETYPSQVKIIPFPDKKAIRAIVVGDDESGNIYKQLYLQDATGAILLTVDMTGLFGTYSVGQEVIVELQGLCIGRYAGAFQIGSPLISRSVSASGRENFNMSRMKPYDFYNNVHANGKPDISKANDLIKTITEIPLNIDRNDMTDEKYREREHLFNTLVRFKNVLIEDNGNIVFAPPDINGDPQYGVTKLRMDTTMDIRTSGYANFAGDTVPVGQPCNVTAIFSEYQGNFQIILRTRKDIEIINN